VTITVLFFVEVPIGDVGVHALPTDLAVRSKGGDFILHFVLSSLDWAEIFIGIAPGIFRQLGQVSSELPFLRDHSDGGLFNERLESLFGRRIASSVLPMIRGTTRAARMAKMATTTMISMKVKACSS
jgi:hypothetical protein